MPAVQSNGISIFYEVSGSGKPLLLIGGLSIDLTQLKDVVDGLALKHTVVAFDNRGVGRSEKPDAPYSVELMAEDAAGLLAGLGTVPADIVGISLGGRIALSLALRRPELVGRLVLASTSARTNHRRGLGWQVSNQLLRIPWVRRIGTKYPQPYYAYVRQREASKGYDVTGRLGEVSKPTLILHGRKDGVCPYQLAEEMHAGIRGSELVTFEGGHIFMFRNPRGFVSAIESFLGEPAQGTRESPGKPST